MVLVQWLFVLMEFFFYSATPDLLVPYPYFFLLLFLLIELRGRILKIPSPSSSPFISLSSLHFPPLSELLLLSPCVFLSLSFSLTKCPMNPVSKQHSKVWKPEDSLQRLTKQSFLSAQIQNKSGKTDPLFHNCSPVAQLLSLCFLFRFSSGSCQQPES